MNMLLEQGQLTDMNCGANYTCILNDNSLFLPTEYKVLQSQNNSCFVKCMKMQYNGKIQFFYLTAGYQSFDGLLHMLTPDSFLTIVSNLLADIIDVKNNGFLSCLNIDISFEHIFVDASNYQVRLIYVPSGKKIFSDNSMFENELRTGLVKLISKNESLSSSKTFRLMQDLSNGMMPLEDLYKRIKGNHNVRPVSSPAVDGIASPAPRINSSCRIVSVGTPSPVVVDVTKDEFVIGKKVGSVDGVISFSKVISRVHCKIIREKSNYFIMDMHSANGTYVNNMRLQPDVMFQIRNDDIVRLANCEFKVQIG